MAFEDGAVLAKIFSHLLREDQISSFLYAFQDIRQERVARMLRNEMTNIIFMVLPNSEIQEQRDNGMRALHKQGRNVLETGVSTEQWEEIKLVFAYECEDEADNWSVSISPGLVDGELKLLFIRWVNWGLLREHASGYSMSSRLNAEVSRIQVAGLAG